MEQTDRTSLLVVAAAVAGLARAHLIDQWGGGPTRTAGTALLVGFIVLTLIRLVKT